MSKFLEDALNIAGSSSEKIDTPENIDQQIAKCRAEIDELKGTGTIISTVINFSEKIGKTLFGSASSSDESNNSDESNKIPEGNAQKIKNLENELASLYARKKPSERQKGESSDSPDGLTEEELKGDLLEYVKQLEDGGIPYEVIRKDGMIGIRTTTPGGDQNLMSNMLKNMMEKMVSKLPRSSEESSVDKNSDITLDDDAKSQVQGVISTIKKSTPDFCDDQPWYEGDEVLDATRNNTNMDKYDKNDNSELLGITQSEIFETQIGFFMLGWF